MARSLVNRHVIKDRFIKQVETVFLSFGIWVLFLMFISFGCKKPETPSVAPEVPRGYVQVLEVERDGRLFSFGPFVGYYFRPQNPDDLHRIDFVCFNERSFYTLDLPGNALLFEGDALLATLEDAGFMPEFSQRITPVYFEDAPVQWLKARPSPQDEFVHFHSCHDATGPVLTGYWIRHVGKGNFTYDMGGRIILESVLYHNVSPGPDKGFARIVEFDRGLAPKVANSSTF